MIHGTWHANVFSLGSIRCMYAPHVDPQLRGLLQALHHSSFAMSASAFLSLVTELKLLIFEACTWDSLLLLRRTSRSFRDLVDNAFLSGGNCALWYTSGKETKIWSDDEEAMTNRHLGYTLHTLKDHLRITDNSHADDGGSHAVFWKKGYMSPVNENTRVHRVLGLLYIPDTEADEGGMFQMIAGCFIKNFSEEGVYQQTEDGSSDRILLPFGKKSLFDPPIYTPVPVRIRYKLQPNEPSTDREMWKSRLCDVKLIIKPEEEGNFITIHDAIRLFEPKLDIIFRWEERLIVNRINTYINPNGWLDLVLSITLTGPSTDYDEYVPPYPTDLAALWHGMNPEYDDTSDQHDSESDLSETVYESPVIWPEANPHPGTWAGNWEPSDDEEGKDQETYRDKEWYKQGMALVGTKGHFPAYESTMVPGFPSLGSWMKWEAE